MTEPHLSSRERRALSYIEGYYLSSGELPSHKSIAEKLNFPSRTTAQRIRDKLRKAGLLKPTKLKRKSRGGEQ